MAENPKILIYGYGNPGRLDDGCGVVFTEELSDWIKEEGIPGVDCDSNYQLNIEDADVISGYDMVFFVDASIEEIEHFAVSEVKPTDSRIEFTMHAVSPGFVLDLCHQIFNRVPRTYLIHIKGYEWDFKEGTSESARKNINLAVDWMKSVLRDPEVFEQTAVSPKQLVDI